jgi:hypothetical protein
MARGEMSRFRERLNNRMNGAMDGHDAQIVINGQRLTTSQVITIRVALDVFAQQLGAPEQEEKRGKTMAEGFRSQIDEIRTLIQGKK